MARPSLTVIFSGIVFSYIAYSIWSLADLFFIPACVDNKRCFHSILKDKPDLSLFVLSSVRKTPDSQTQIVSVIDSIDYSNPWEKKLTLNLPLATRNNGTLYLHLALIPRKAYDNTGISSLLNNKEMVYTGIFMTPYHVPDIFIFNLLKDEPNASDQKKEALMKSAKPVSHLKTEVTFNIMTDPLSIPNDSLPPEMYSHFRLAGGSKFLPIVKYNFLETKIEHLKMIENATEVITLKYAPIRLGQLRLVMQVEMAIMTMKKLGFNNKDVDDIKGLFASTNLPLLCTTIAITSFHLLLDFLAFKNEISFWRRKSSMEGMSARTVLWGAFSQCVVFLYLMDEKASFLVLIPTGINLFIEIWKVIKVGRMRKLEVSETEKITEKYDVESMRYLSYLLYPLCVGGAIFSLFYQPHRSWYSWCLKSMVNGVYAFGFLFMLPQLFINYRLKSVAALPWKAFMYKACNTFIDDVFAFIITMPTSHRYACFRDDVVFLIYLYQRWLYPVDSSRLDETAKALGEKPKDDVDNLKKEN